MLLDVYGVVYVDGKVNLPLLEPLTVWRQRGLRVALASNMASEQKVLFWDGLGLRAFADKLLCSGDFYVAKPALSFYGRAQIALDAAPESILFFDDSGPNVEAARICGWHAHLYNNAATTLKTIETHYGF